MKIASFVLFAMCAACASLTTIDPSSPREREIRVAGTDLSDWKGIVHCHGRLSHDSTGTLEEIVAACHETGVRFVVMTDHQTEASIRDGARGIVDDVLFVVGAEVRSPQGTILAFPLQKPLVRWQHAGLLVKEAGEQGALAFVCHAELWKIPWAGLGLAGAEIVNLHAGAMTASYAGTLATALFLPLRSLMERICVRDDRVFAEWDRELRTTHPFTPVGGDDAHANVRVFGPLGGTIGTYREVFATLSTHVLAPRLDEEALVDAFRRGRTYVVFDVFGDGSGFDFRAVAGDEVHLPGDTVDGRPGLVLRARTPAVAAIRLLRDGALAAENVGEALELRDPAPGVYRVEVARDGDPWIFSSTIRVEPSVDRGGR
ncbi:MAG: hypothetical protein JNK78_00210 [Planctomycetes bacterium]|nr:hypothetical protein [Planctomycetota bacterium]